MANYNYQVTPTVTNGVVSWSLCLEQKGSKCSPSAASNVHVGYVPNPTFKFTINDNTNQFQFDSNKDGPIWIQFGTKPTTYVVDSQIGVPNGAGRKSLTFTDKNDVAGVLMYRLNFVDKSGAKSFLDPDITNGGHGVYNTASILLLAAGVAAVVAAIVSGAVMALATRRASVHSARNTSAAEKTSGPADLHPGD